MRIIHICFTSFIIIVVCVFSIHVTAAQGLDVTANKVNGDVEMMLPNSHQWIPVKDGAAFSEGTQIRTGPSSSVSLVFADSSVALVDSFSYLTIEKFLKSESVVTTRIKLPIGAIVSTLNDQTTLENDYEIVTPGSSVTLNGTEIKKVVAGAMYNDRVRTGNRKK